jgi:hypothetical protein
MMSSSAYRGSDEAARARTADLEEELNYARKRAVTIRLDLVGKEQHEPIPTRFIRAPYSMTIGAGILLTLGFARPQLADPVVMRIFLGVGVGPDGHSFV